MISVKRIMDANFNRTREGLRVLEDLVRFVLNDKSQTAKLKILRHDVSQLLHHASIRSLHLIESRNSRRDVGKKSLINDRRQIHWQDLAVANFKRVEESLRVLEECSKILAPVLTSHIQSLRFQAYELEKRIIKKFQTLRHHRSQRS